ncbi:alpha/beta fold hydrolase [Nonomuraea sp. NPDC050663]|uniref:alpha/beta fold hydrolase n=1 Tax=Nonomuraea sp. NPDC050663 TaxID=3364370 RepID=UPI00378F2EC6
MRKSVVLLAGVGVGAAAGLLARRRRARPASPEPAMGEQVTVTTADGVRLAVEVDRATDPKAAVVFAHGWVLNRHAWFPQREALAGQAMLVAYDHRGHGASTAGSSDCCTIEQLAEDLEAVIEAVVPAGVPVVLVGHSMGGMTVMGLAARRPELFGERVRSVVLMSTSCGGMAGNTFGLPGPVGRLVPRLTPLVMERALKQAAWIDRRTAVRARTNRPATRYLAFGPGARPQDVKLVNDMIAATPTEVMVGFFNGILAHDKLSALRALAGVETHVLVGSHDRLTSPAHARRIAGALPHATLTVVPSAGHMLGLERPDTVNEVLGRLVRAAAR